MTETPRHPRGKTGPAGAKGRDVLEAKIATGELPDDRPPPDAAAQELGRKGGKARAENLSKERRSEIARKAAAKRWNKNDNRGPANKKPPKSR